MSHEGRFPGHREPQSIDNLRASAPLAPSFLHTFKKSLPVSRRPSFFASGDPPDDPQHDAAASSNPPNLPRPGNNGPVGQSNASGEHLQQELQYPVSMFTAFPDIPSPDTLNVLLTSFAHRFLTHAPFLRNVQLVSISDFQQDKRPKFLIFAMAALGAAMSDDRQLNSLGPNLWQAAAYVHSAACEMDNRMARRVDWVISFVILAVYGIMHADGELWSKVNIWNGHVDTSAKRIGLHNLQSRIGSDGTPNVETQLKDTDSRTLEHSKIMSFYFLVDLLRSLQLGVPSSFQASDLSIALSDGTPFRRIYEDLILYSKPIPKTLSPDDYLLLLLSILSEILVLFQWLGPIRDISSNASQMDDLDRMLAKVEGPTNGQYRSLNQIHGDMANSGDDSMSEDTSDSTASYLHKNPFLVFSANAEYTRISNLLNVALDEWKSTCLSQRGETLAPQHSGPYDAQVGGPVIPLYYFCRMILSGGPALIYLLSAAGFSPEKHFKAPQYIDPHLIPHINDETVDNAWNILGAVEQVSSQASDAGNGTSSTQLWVPIILFYAGLTVWASLQGPLPAYGAHGGVRRKQMLRLFEVELRDLTWPCASTMADTLKDLRMR